MRTQVIGRPGTGKTTYALGVVESALADGTPPSRIGFVSFTRKAADEAAKRAAKRFSLDEKELKYFRTLHSLGYQQLGLTSGSVLSKHHLEEIGDILGLTFSHKALQLQLELTASKHKGDIYMSMLSHARSACINLSEAFRVADTKDHRITYLEFERMASFLEEYKEVKCLYDYGDMIERCTIPLDLDILIVDEAQDLSTAQWQMLDRIAADIPGVYVIGDEMQSIYTWAGADVERFMTGPYDRHLVLEHSHRLPKPVWEKCVAIEHATVERVKAHWEPVGSRQGTVTYHNRVDFVPFEEPGSWLLLARNGYLLTQMAKNLKMLGLPFTWSGKSSVHKDHQDAIRNWEDMRKGESITVEMCRKVLDCIRHVSPAAKAFLEKWTDMKITAADIQHLVPAMQSRAAWYDILSGISLEDSTYYRASLRQGTGLMTPARHHLGTIHSVKGGEADNVVLLTDISPVTHRAYMQDPDAEHRVFFVGGSRARHNLHVVLPQTRCYYRFP